RTAPPPTSELSTSATAATSVVRLPVLPLTVMPLTVMATLLHATVPRRRRQCRSHRYGRAELAWVSRLNRAAGPGDKNSPVSDRDLWETSICRVMCGPDIRVGRTRFDAGRKARDRHGHADTHRHAAG